MMAEFAAMKAEIAQLKAAAVPAKAAKVKAPKAATNSTGPKGWNEFRKQVWIDMAAEVGVIYSDLVDLEGVDPLDKDAMKKAEEPFKKAAAAAGATNKASMQEASKRKAELDGKEYVPNICALMRMKKAEREGKEYVPKAAPKPKDAASDDEKLREIKEKVAAAKALKAAGSAPAPKAAPKAPAPKAAPKAPAPKAKASKAAAPVKPTLNDEQIAAAEHLGWEERVFDGVYRWFDPLDNCVYVYDGDMEQIGQWDEDEGKVLACD